MHEPSAVNPDVAHIQRIDAIPRILSAVAQITGMRFCAVARVTDTRWTACAVLDESGFGLVPGDELELETTLCNEVRQHHMPVAFDRASTHPVYSQHHTPRIYGLESYISVPIFRRTGDFFGTLCAIDSRPAEVEDLAVVKSLQLFAEMIGLQLELVDDLDAARARLRDADFRQELLGETERDIRNIFQPIVTSLYLLRTSPTLSDEDRVLVEQMEACSLQLTDLLHRQLDVTVERIEERLAGVHT
ncbi:GAF domain-containing protein [Lysobacter sp. GX 14042]|uniref:GAF domain-containing protein n=1 Tax=Lysobacter sp. GX 14042 TaxID=2907155 RepID=UPI001F25A082|nr:GAF domain-containing protein [Lysobacter sp. GX 14042]MCE7032923.1 GAF domain-containing protein [Lysobacter sp. GX 14042]